MYHHIDYEIDKKKYRKIFYDNIQKHGKWHWSVPVPYGRVGHMQPAGLAAVLVLIYLSLIHI